MVKLEEISKKEFFKELKLPENFLKIKIENPFKNLEKRNCNKPFQNSSDNYFKKVKKETDRITNIPRQGKETVIGFKECLYNYAIKKDKFDVLNSTNYTMKLNNLFLLCKSEKQTVRLVLPLNPKFKIENRWRITANEIQFLLKHKNFTISKKPLNENSKTRVYFFKLH